MLRDESEPVYTPSDVRYALRLCARMANPLTRDMWLDRFVALFRADDTPSFDASEFRAKAGRLAAMRVDQTRIGNSDHRAVLADTGAISIEEARRRYSFRLRRANGGRCASCRYLRTTAGASDQWHACCLLSIDVADPQRSYCLKWEHAGKSAVPGQ